MKKGIDIGGTFVKVLWENGRREKIYVKDTYKDRKKTIDTLLNIIREGNPEKVGVAVAGFTSKEGRIYHSPNIPALNDLDLGKILRDLNINFVIGNDVTVAAFGEWYYDNRDSENLILVAVGTGLGGGFVYKGEPFYGTCGSALELGHHIIEKDGERCNCGRKGCWEAYCSSYGIERIYEKLTGQKVSAHEIAEKARQEEKEALETVEEFKRYLIIGLVNIVHIFNPDRIILGGGLIDDIREFLGDVEDRLKMQAEGLPASCVSVGFSLAGEFLGARGALALAQI